MLLNDREIKRLVKLGMIEPFVDHLVRVEDGKKVISYGLSSSGYDIRLADHDFRVFKKVDGDLIDPKNFSESHLEKAKLHTDKFGDYFIIPGGSYGLGVSLEKIKMPRDVMALCYGKSTYARVAIMANVTPIEAGWQGHITLEFSNDSPTDAKIYANEGVIQLVFLRCDEPMVSYEDRRGKYQDQGKQVVLARV